MDKQCFSCRFFKAYYTKGYANFTKTDLGYCVHRKQTLNKHDGCESHCVYHYGKLDGKTVIKHLYEALNSLNAIAAIWSEEQDNK